MSVHVSEVILANQHSMKLLCVFPGEPALFLFIFRPVVSGTHEYFYSGLWRSSHNRRGTRRFSGNSDFLRNVLEDNEHGTECFKTFLDQAMADTCLTRVVVAARGNSMTGGVGKKRNFSQG